LDDHAETRWGAAKYVIKPRKRTETLLQGWMLPEQLHLWGHVTPDVGAQRILLHVQRPAQPSLWEEVPLGPGSSFDFELQGSFPFEQVVRATAHFDGTNEFSSSVSETITLIINIAG